jgi:diacylglycerol kinase family enzyme
MAHRGRRPVAILIDNPNAGRLSDEEREGVLEAIRENFEIDQVSTTARTTGIGIAKDVAASGEDIVIAFGGDGHVNEVANGLAGTDSTLAVIPGGTMNVFARSLGIPMDPFEAIRHLRDRMFERSRRVSLGLMDDRYFTFSAGCGFDAEAAERVDLDILAKRRFGEFFFFWSAFRVLLSGYRYRNPTMTVKGEFGEERVAMAIASNTGPYAYLGRHSVEIAPRVELDAGLDVFGLRKMRMHGLPVYAWRCVVSKDLIHDKDAFYESDLDGFEITGDEPFKRHVDGEPLDRATSSRFSIARDVLKVKA